MAELNHQTDLVIRSVYPRGTVLQVVREGSNSHAITQGPNAIAVAVGAECVAEATPDDGAYKSCAVAAGDNCRAEVTGAGACGAVAVGIGSTAISNTHSVEAVAIGYEPFAKMTEAKGTAISIGVEPSAQAEEGAYLVFIDTSQVKPQVAVFKVDPAQGIWPNIPYCWEGGMPTPRPDVERIDQEAMAWLRNAEASQSC